MEKRLITCCGACASTHRAGLTHEQHGHRTFPQHAFRVTAQQCASEAAAAVGADDDQLAAGALRRGYGRKGARVYDFGWVPAPKGWGNGAMSVMRLQMHATDPDHLEQRLGTAQSKGCIRISASLNEFIDRHGVLDEDYQKEMDDGRRRRVLRSDWTPTPWSGRYLVVVDSMSSEQPGWSGQPSER